mgnify:CR=1 FL=1
MSGAERRLRIVMVLDDPPWSLGSAASRWYSVLCRGLVERGHRLTVLAAGGDPSTVSRAQEEFAGSGLDLRWFEPDQRRGLAARWRTWRRPVAYRYGPALRAEFAGLMSERPDIIDLEATWAGWLEGWDPARTVLSILSWNGLDLKNAPVGSWKDHLVRRSILRGERSLVRRFKWLRVCSERLAGAVGQVNPRAGVTTVPLGIDAGRYEWRGERRRPGDRPATIGVIGSLFWWPSRAAALRLATRLGPLVQERRPGTLVRIVGWSARSVLSDLLDRPGLEIVENVPDPRPEFARLDVLVYAPPVGTGMKIKIQEALAMGIPVVTNAEGVEGLGASDGVEVGLAENDDDAALVDRIVDLLDNPELGARRALAGRRLLEARCSPRVTVDALEAGFRLMDEVASGRSRRRTGAG